MFKNKILVIFSLFFISHALYGAKPLGGRFRLLQNDEVAVVDNSGSGFFDIYEPESNSYEQSFGLPGVALDIGSGDLNNSGIDEIVGVYSNSVYIRWYNGTSWQGQSYALGKSGMKYVACGDYFEDSINIGYEIVTASADSIFWWKWSQSTGLTLLKAVGPSGGIYDICCGDIDGDRYDEVVYLTSAKQCLNLEYINEDGSRHTCPTFITLDERGSYISVCAGNLRADIKEEVIILETKWWPSNDVLHFYEYDSTFIEIKTINIGHRGDLDLACGNADTDKYEEVFLLRGDRKVDVFNFDGLEGTFNLSGSSDPVRIAAPDWDGDNAQLVFTGGPYLCSSELWPTLVLSLPPYHNGIVQGECTIKYGEDYQQNQNLEATLSLTAQTTMGYKFQFPGGLFEANVSASIEAGIKKHLKEHHTFSWGSWYQISSNYPHNIVMAARTYYDGFFYKIFDPRNLLGDTLDQDTINLAVPKASSSSIPITLENYLAYADTIDYLPKGLLLPIQQPGDVTTYPQGYVYPNGYPIPSEELLFVNHPIYSITQGVQGGWYIYLQETQVHDNVLYSQGNLAVKVSGQIPGGPFFSFQIAGAIGAQKTHQFKMGRELLIEATMGYLHDTLNFWQWYYEYSPYIYHASSDSGGFYVLNFMVQNLGWGYQEIEEGNKAENLKAEIRKLAVYPNPFSTLTKISYAVDGKTAEPQNSKTISLKIYDATGRLVKQFNHLTIQPFNQVTWFGDDDSGCRVPAGIYFVRLESGDFEKTEKVILMK
ncbi:MAG: T9SS type A sorting domain-containing protein [bacterium]